MIPKNASIVQIDTNYLFFKVIRFFFLVQNVDVKALLREYDSVTGLHNIMEPEAFNDDHTYKSCLDEVGSIFDNFCASVSPAAS
jgi:hypothetical protein